MATLKPTDRTERDAEHNGFPYKIVSYKLGDTYKATATNISPDAVIARGEGATREEAEAEVVEAAERRLARTRRTT